MKSYLRILGLFLAVLAIRPAAGADEDKPAPKLEDLLPDPVIARGKGFQVKQSDLDQVVSGLKASARANGTEIPPERLPQVTRELLDGIIQMRILNNLATDDEKARGKAEGDRRYEDIRKQAATEESLSLKLKSVGLTIEKLRTRLTEEATAQTVMHDKVKVSDDDIKKFYEDNPAKFEQPEMVRISHILLATRDPKSGSEISDDEKRVKLKQAQALDKRARDGEDFAKLAKDFSDDINSKTNGGEVKISRGMANVPMEFEAAAFSLKTNQVSDVVTSPIGYHIIKFGERIPAQRVELDKVKDDIRRFLQRQEIERILPAYYAQLKKENNVEILDEQLKALEAAADAEAAKTNAIKSGTPGSDKPKDAPK
jgi:parvulin-like peptidyl-prolyl isomerase